MKIRFVILNGYAGGGTVRTAVTMANELSSRHDVELVSVVRNRQRPTFEVEAAVRIVPLVDSRTRRPEAPHRPWPVDALLTTARRALRAAPTVLAKHDVRHRVYSAYSDVKLWRYLRGLDGGVVIGTRPGLNLAIARLAPPSVVKVGQEHLNLGRHRPALRTAIEEWYPRLDALATLTTPDADAFTDLLGDRLRVLAVPNAVPDLHGATADPGGDAKVIVAAGRLTPQKGFDMLLRAFAELAPRHPGWQLRIYGRGPLKAKLEDRIAELGLTGRARLMGFSSSIHRAFARSSIYVMSSKFEGFPMVLLEAMGCGLPPVSFDCPTGPGDIITHGRDGLLVPPKDVGQLATAMERLMLDPALRRSMGAAARLTVHQYSADAIGHRWEDLFVELGAARGVRV